MTSHDPKRFVLPELSEARINKLWANVSERLERRPPPRFRWLGLGVAVAAVAAASVLLVPGLRERPSAPEASVLAGATLETAGDSLSVTLVDGSSVRVASQSRVEVRGNQPTNVVLSLESGSVACDVTHREDRRFVVAADGVEVSVVGTQFSVKSTPEAGGKRVEVDVVRGLVEVRSKRRPGVVALVGAGQSWVQAAEAPARAEVEKAEPPVQPLPPAAATAGSASAPEGARELFEQANEHRRAGDARKAAGAYEELLRRFPGDGRSGLAAFELGRLRLDRLGDPAGAVQALERALTLSGASSFREDALARLATAHTRLGNTAACERARARYLESYPKGVHANAEALRCGKR